MITLTDGITTLTLPAGLDWTDERAWAPVEQSAEYSLTGALIIDVATRDAGRPITLESGPDRDCVTLAQADQLQTWADEPDLTLTLTLRGAARAVMYRHQDAPALVAEPLGLNPDGAQARLYRLTLKLMEI